MAAGRPPPDLTAPCLVGLIGITLVIALLGLAFRLFQVQVVQAADLAGQGLDQRLVTRDLAPQRGKIYDRNGEPLR